MYKKQEIHDLVFQMDRRMTKTAVFLNNLDDFSSYNVNSGSFICVEKDKSVCSFSNPGKKMCEKISREQEARLYILESMALLNSLPKSERELLYDYFICSVSLNKLSKKHKQKDIKGALYLALLDLAVLDPLNNFSISDRDILDDKYKTYNSQIDFAIQEINQLKNKILDGYYHDCLKAMPSISKDVQNDYYFVSHSGRSHHDYKKRSILALAVYYIQNPYLPPNMIDQLVSIFGFGHRFIQKVKTFIDKGGFTHEG